MSGKTPIEQAVAALEAQEEFITVLMGEVKNLRDKLNRNEAEGWEGSQRRSIHHPQKQKNIEVQTQQALAALRASTGMMKPAEEWIKNVTFGEVFFDLRELIVKVQQDAIAAAQPEPSGDALELAIEIMEHGKREDGACYNSMSPAEGAALIQSFATATRKKALANVEEVIQPLINDLRAMPKHYVPDLNVQRAEDFLRALAKRGG